MKGVRDRHDGIARNPWNEFECGHHYARAMASWSLILALSGFHYDAREAIIAFAPKVNADDFKCFYSTGSGWGTYTQTFKANALEATLQTTYGQLPLKTLALSWPNGDAPRRVKLAATLDGPPIKATAKTHGPDLAVSFDNVTLKPAADLRLRISATG